MEVSLAQVCRSSEMGANPGHDGDFVSGKKINRCGIKAGVGTAGKALQASERGLVLSLLHCESSAKVCGMNT